ncbi:ElaA protein [Pseudoalteromonas luteoviolacea B = ATCC 29581]|nr:ElaA protein [Pseudoalteromonas luteoviolacea B = ATCC 29581]
MNQITLKRFNELSVDELYDFLKLRVDVFVVEQSCPYPELDNIDKALTTVHFLVRHAGEIVAYGRCYEKTDNILALGRIVVSKGARGNGSAKTLLRAMLAYCGNHSYCNVVFLSAQVYLKAFYRAFGFEEIGEEYLEDGIPHQDMQLNLQ